MTVVVFESIKKLMNQRIAVYPGTFDPVTNGHLDVLRRASSLFDKIVVALSPNKSKKPLFSLDERMEFLQESISEYDNVELQSFQSLTVEFVRSIGAKTIIRGIRVISDFEYEFQMAMMNRSLDPDIETIFLMPSEDYFFTSSSLIKQIAGYTEQLDRFVPSIVKIALTKKYFPDG